MKDRELSFEWESGWDDAIQTLCDEGSLTYDGRTFQPNEHRGYVKFGLSHCYPVVTAYGTAIEAATVRNSSESLRHQVFNLAHRMKAYHPDGKNMKGDNILGSILDVRTVEGSGGRVHIEGIAAYAKLAHRMSDVIAQHKGGRHKWTVSMEVRWYPMASTWVVGRDGGAFEEVLAAAGTARVHGEKTPEEWRRRGLMIVPFSEAPEELVACWDDTQRRVISPFNGQPAVVLMGGINGRVAYHGVGLVPYGAEPTAEIQSMAAEHPILTTLDELNAAVRGIFQK